MLPPPIFACHQRSQGARRFGLAPDFLRHAAAADAAASPPFSLPAIFARCPLPLSTPPPLPPPDTLDAASPFSFRRLFVHRVCAACRARQRAIRPCQAAADALMPLMLTPAPAAQPLMPRHAASDAISFRRFASLIRCFAASAIFRLSRDAFLRFSARCR